jgi:copper chaperone
MANVVLNVPNISCEHCERTINETLQALDGVRLVQVNIPAKQVKVDYDEQGVSLQEMQTALRDEDYPVESVA